MSTITTRSTLIRDDAGGTRVYRPFVCEGFYTTLIYNVPADTAMCVRCGCTERLACWEGCGWFDRHKRICTRCAERIMR